MAEKKKGYGWMLLLTVVLTLSGLVTLIPNAGASKTNLLGYRSLCSSVPISTLVLFLAVAVVCFIRKKNFS